MNKGHFFYRHEGILKRLFIDEVVFLEADKNYVKFYQPGSTIMVRISFDAALKLLPEKEFVQIQRSVAVAIKCVENIGRGGVSLIGHPDKIHYVSKKHYPLLVKRVTIFETLVAAKEKKKT